MNTQLKTFAPDTSLALLQAQQSRTPALDAKKLAQTEKTAVEFESVMLAEMLKPMFEGIEVDAQFGGGKGEEVFRGFMLQEYGKIMARAGGIGIADAVKKELIRMQGEADKLSQNNDVIDVTGVEINASTAAK